MWKVNMDISISFKVSVGGRHNPRGPDGKGWNRIAIHGLEPTTRCSMRPVSRQAGLDTLRGMAQFGVASEYKDCTSALPCSACPLIAKRLPESCSVIN